MSTSTRFSARGMAAIRRGLLPRDKCAAQLNIPLNRMESAPKREWHHDLQTGEKMWFHDPLKVWAWWIHQK